MRGPASGPGRYDTVRGVNSLVEDGTRPDFFPVVILGVNPEDGDGGDVVIARHLLGKLERGERLEEREQRSAEESRLLTGENGDRSLIGEQPRRFAGARRRLTPLLLSGDDGGDVVAAAVVRLRSRDRVRPRRPIGRIAGEERRDGAESRTRSRPRAFESTGNGARRLEYVPKASDEG